MAELVTVDHETMFFLTAYEIPDTETLQLTPQNVWSFIETPAESLPLLVTPVVHEVVMDAQIVVDHPSIVENDHEGYYKKIPDNNPTQSPVEIKILQENEDCPTIMDDLTVEMAADIPAEEDQKPEVIKNGLSMPYLRPDWSPSVSTVNPWNFQNDSSSSSMDHPQSSTWKRTAKDQDDFSSPSSPVKRRRGQRKDTDKHKDRPFACNHCSYKASRKCTLKVHMMSHLGLKPFTCSSCSYASAYRKDLRNHIARHHTKVKGYKCRWCDYATYTSRELSMHLQVHSDRIFKCDLCGFTTKHQKSIGNHFDKRHAKSVESQ